MMTDIPTQDTEPQPAMEAAPPLDDEALKERLLNRVIVAAVIVAGLLGSLAIFDTIKVPAVPASGKIAAPPVAPVVASAPATVPEAKEPAGAAENAGEAAPGVAQQAEAGVPERSAAPDSLPLQPLPGEKPLTKLATGRLAMLHPAAPASIPAATPPAEPARELTRSRPAAPPSGATHHAAERPAAFRPLTQMTERHFGLQLGVFSNLANAEDLRAKLEKNGIPAVIEARVRVGPFATRAEAEGARAKLKELGIDDGLLVTMKNKSPS